MSDVALGNATISIDVESRAGVKLGAGPIVTAYDLRFNNPIDKPGQFSFSMPASDTKSSILAIKSTVVRIYLDGVVRFLGIVKSLSYALSQDGVLTLAVTGTDLTEELIEQTTSNLSLVASSAGITSAPTEILDSGDEQTWSLDATYHVTTTNTFYAQFDHASKMNALNKCATFLGEHWVYRPDVSGADRELIWMRDDTSDSGIRAIAGAGEMVQTEEVDEICFITRLEREEDGQELVNRIYPYGAGQGAARLDLSSSSYSGDVGTPTAFNVNRTSNYIDRKYTGYAYTAGTGAGEYLFNKAVEFKEIAPLSNTDADYQAAADMLADAAMRWLERYADVHVFYRLSVIKLDYAAILPGNTIHVTYYDIDADGVVVEDIDTDLIVLDIATTVDRDGAIRYELLVSTIDRFPSHDALALASEIEQGQVFTTLPQLGPSIDTIAYKEQFDDAEAADLYFWLGAEIALVQQVLMRYRIDPLRSTVKSIAGSSTTTDSGGSSTPTSGSSSASSSGSSSEPGVTGAQLADHRHTETGTTTDIQDASHSHNFTTPAHAHTIAHTHDVTIAAHTHDLTPVLSSLYGIYEDSGSSVITDPATGISIYFGGVVAGTAPATAATFLGSGWYEQDLTYDVSDATTFRPNGTNFLVSFLAASGLQGTVTAQIQIRSIVQSIAYL